VGGWENEGITVPPESTCRENYLKENSCKGSLLIARGMRGRGARSFDYAGMTGTTLKKEFQGTEGDQGKETTEMHGTGKVSNKTKTSKINNDVTLEGSKKVVTGKNTRNGNKRASSAFGGLK